jgi:membrane-associated phospholipid phosphatase
VQRNHFKREAERNRRSLRYVRLLVSALAFAIFLIVPSPALFGQDDPSVPDPAAAAPASLQIIPSSAAQRDVSPRLLPANFLRDQKNMWFFPGQLAKGRHWSPVVTVTAATIALFSTDPYVEPYFHHTKAFRRFDRAFNSKVTGQETIAIPTALYLVGLGTHDSYMQKTALFAGEAVLDSEMVRMAMNTTTARWRPEDVARQQTYGHTFFRNKVHVGSSFPSGHTIVAVSVATVIARRYRSHRWVPWVAYGLAGTIGFSRMSLRTHFPSDVFLATVLGYAIARYDVLQDY